MNAYALQFDCRCPADGALIRYSWHIESPQMIRVEELLAAIPKEPTFHEHLADLLHAKFSGRQTIFAEHCGVYVTTTREG